MIEIFLTFSAFILAFFALVNRIIIFRLNMGILPMRKLLWLLIFLGIIALIKAPIDFFLLNETITKNTLTYYQYIDQIIKFLWNAVLVTIIVYLFYKLTTPSKFHQKKSEKYLNECILIIYSGIDVDIQKLAEEVSYSIPFIFDCAFREKNNGNERYASSVIVLFSDEAFCKKIIKYNPVTLYYIFETIRVNCDNFLPEGKILIDKLIQVMFIDPESQLNREELPHGLGQFGTFKKLIFGDLKFLKSLYSPLSACFKINRAACDATFIDKYFEIMEYALKVYLTEKDDSPDIFNSAFSIIVHVIANNISSLKNSPNMESVLDNLSACARGMIGLMFFIRQNTDAFPVVSDVCSEGYCYFRNDRNIYGAIADGVYSIILSLSINHCGFESIRILLLGIYDFYDESTSPALRELQIRVDILLSNKIKESLTKFYAPDVIAGLIYSLGLFEPEEARNQIHKLLLTKLKQNYLTIYNSNSKIALNMLPPGIEIDVKSKKLIGKEPYQWGVYNTTQHLFLDDN